MKRKYVLLFCLISLLSLSLLVNATEKSELQIKTDKFFDLFTEVSNYKKQLSEINFQNKKLFFEEKLTDTKKNDFINSLENILEIREDLLFRTNEFVDEINILVDSASTYNDYNNYNKLLLNAVDLVYAEHKLFSTALDQKSLIVSQNNMNIRERQLYNEIISIKLDFANLRLNLALR